MFIASCLLNFTMVFTSYGHPSTIYDGDFILSATFTVTITIISTLSSEGFSVKIIVSAPKSSSSSSKLLYNASSHTDCSLIVIKYFLHMSAIIEGAF